MVYNPGDGLFVAKYLPLAVTLQQLSITDPSTVVELVLL